MLNYVGRLVRLKVTVFLRCSKNSSEQTQVQDNLWHSNSSWLVIIGARGIQGDGRYILWMSGLSHFREPLGQAQKHEVMVHTFLDPRRRFILTSSQEHVSVPSSIWWKKHIFTIQTLQEGKVEHSNVACYWNRRQHWEDLNLHLTTKNCPRKTALWPARKSKCTVVTVWLEQPDRTGPDRTSLVTVGVRIWCYSRIRTVIAIHYSGYQWNIKYFSYKHLSWRWYYTFEKVNHFFIEIKMVLPLTASPAAVS